jgi:hypothetical protein
MMKWRSGISARRRNQLQRMSGLMSIQKELNRTDINAKRLPVPKQAGYYGSVAHGWMVRKLHADDGLLFSWYDVDNLVYELARRAAAVAIGWDWATCDVCDLPTPERMTRFVDDRESAEAFQVYEQRLLVCDDCVDDVEGETT